MRFRFLSIFIITGLLLSLTNKANASLIITELLADPPAGLSGDANQDGKTSSIEDEFVELFNLSESAQDISGWYINDAVKTRHVFSAGTLLASNQYLVVFGGGDPNLPGIFYQTASTGSLGLNNGGDIVSLFNSTDQLISEVPYGVQGGKNQSIVRYPEIVGSDFVLHASLTEANGKLYSPGEPVVETQETREEDPVSNQTTVPEPGTMVMVAMGLVAFVNEKFKAKNAK